MNERVCTHKWRKVHEETLLGGHSSVGWRCIECNEFVAIHALTPKGLSGIVTGEHELIGPHGCRGQTASGKPYSKQIIYEDGRLEIIP